LGARSEVFNIGVDEEIRIDDLAKLIMDVAGLNKEIRGTEPNVGETQRRCPDIRKISELGFRKQISLKVGIEELVLIRKTEVR
jgi:UDP-glucose 4-epimerase